jgi:hypothetical protein
MVPIDCLDGSSRVQTKPVPIQDHPIELHNLLLEADQLGAERGKAREGAIKLLD